MPMCSFAMPPWEQVFDVVVVGGGYAGFAATLQLSAAGRRVLLIDRHGGLVWESGRAFSPDAGDADDPIWAAFTDALVSRGAAMTGYIDGALAEVVATDMLLGSGATVLYYAHPVAVECDRDAVAGLIVATRSGLRRIVAGQWIDATERGDLVRLRDQQVTPRHPTRRLAHFYLQSLTWPESSQLQGTIWLNERCLTVEIDDHSSIIDMAVPALQSLCPIERQAMLSHYSVVPVCWYEESAGGAAAADLQNLACASAALVDDRIASLAHRCLLGVRAAERLREMPVQAASVAQLDRPIPAPRPRQRLEAELVIAGAGTSGSIAAIAAARGGAEVLCVDPMQFVGGVGTGGGIHAYYYGVSGGLQEEIDHEVKQLMAAAGRTLSGGPFNPLAKRIVLERMMRDAGVTLMTGAAIYDAGCDEGRVAHAIAAGPDGPIEVRARAWIDATGDGDLCVLAGAPHRFGREGDGLPHAYSQAAGSLRIRHDGVAIQMLNFDAGWCDPTCSMDLTRARMEGIAQYLADRYEYLSRPTYIAPTIGIRQSRQIETDYVLQLDDLIMRRRFHDTVGYTGCHYDNHAVDYHFETDEAVFWVWVNHAWHDPFGCEISYRMLLPRGLCNVWVASRALGVSQDAHYSMRMQRDMQRTGEVAGVAAAVALRTPGAVDIRSVNYAELVRLLQASGALRPGARGEDPAFGEVFDDGELVRRDMSVGEAFGDLDAGRTGNAIWWLYRHRSLTRDGVLQRVSSPDGNVTWLAAAILAMWGETSAEPRLIRAINAREYGFTLPDANGNGYRGRALDPTNDLRVVPRWVVAATLLRCCGTDRAIATLVSLAEEPELPLDVRALIATTLGRMGMRGTIDPTKAEPVLDRLIERLPENTRAVPTRPLGAMATKLCPGLPPVTSPRRAARHPAWLTAALAKTADDQMWQIHVAVAAARRAMGLPSHPAALPYLRDQRRYVREAMRRAIEGESSVSPEGTVQSSTSIDEIAERVTPVWRNAAIAVGP